jgi:(1->4)-alpha-D-glucan 1-alpha-D-glucosylmutase
MYMKELKETLTLTTIIEDLFTERRIPRATYRLQFNRNFTFRDARELVPYLYDLGISDCYASPLFKARPESDHGYDICDHSRLNPSLGTEQEFEAFSAALQSHDMGLILDMVPNHMGIGHESNLWWMDLLENGPSSKYASYFDIDWHPGKHGLENKLLLPLLEDQYGKVLESGKLQLKYENGAFFIYYYDIKLPVAPRSYSIILSQQLDKLINTLGNESQVMQEFLSILTAISHLPKRTDLIPNKLVERAREKEVIKRRITNLYQSNTDVRAAIDAAVEDFNGTVGVASSFDLLNRLLDEQAYRPAFWRVAAEEINYRRFFDVNELAAIRVELPEVFQSTHQLIFQLLTEGKATGLRIDHPDGLWNPPDYFRQLQEGYVLNKVLARLGQNRKASIERDVAAWFASEQARKESAPCWPLYVVAEKILSENEPLPRDWAIYGTSGYDFLNTINGLFVDSSKEKIFDKIYSGFIETQTNFHSLINSAKKIIMLVSLAGEISALSHQLDEITEKNRRYRDFTLDTLKFAIREIIGCLPVYRTYISGPETVTELDKYYIETAVKKAKKQNPRTAEPIFDFICDTLLLRNLEDFSEEDRMDLVNWVMKFQQVSGPVMAKGVEDTTFYVYNRLVSLNEVGGNPEQFGVSVEAFHRQNTGRQRYWPHSMLSSSTHDTKRSEDVRARISVLSEIPREWRAVLTRWKRFNSSKKSIVNGKPAPDRNDEYLLYQTLVGAWPAEPLTKEAISNFQKRIVAYMQKATKEAKIHTSWFNPNNEYDVAVQNFILNILSEEEDNRFLKDLQLFQRRVAYYGQFNSLSQALLKLASPGVPDFYQGTELWDYSLVDPDNRRPVDYSRRRVLLSDLKSQVDQAGNDLTDLSKELLDTSQDGRIKLYITYRTLSFRSKHQQLFSEGDYLPLEAVGSKSEHVCAFARILEDEVVLAVVPRLLVRLTGEVEQPPIGRQVWEETWLSLPYEEVGRAYRNIFTGEVLSVVEQNSMVGLPMASILFCFPVALFVRI